MYKLTREDVIAFLNDLQNEDNAELRRDDAKSYICEFLESIGFADVSAAYLEVVDD